MKKLFVFMMFLIVAGCAGDPKPQETYPYGMNEKEWNELSIKDKARIRRDFYFYERGHINFVNPEMEVEGRKEQPNPYLQKKNGEISAEDNK